MDARSRRTLTFTFGGIAEPHVGKIEVISYQKRLYFQDLPAVITEMAHKDRGTPHLK